MRRFIKDNRGMTLIELLIAITILGLVAAPLLHGFLTSAQTEVKARKMGEVTSVAQNVMETIEGNGYEAIVSASESDLKTLFALDEDGAAQIVTTSDNKSVVKLTKLAIGDKHYNAMVDINPGGYSGLNSFGLSVNSGMDIVFEVPKLAREDIQENKVRDIKVDITLEGTKLNILVQYEEEIKKVENYSITNGLTSVYLFYYPSYKTDGSDVTSMKDNIIISNESGLKLDFYIVKQKDNVIAATPTLFEYCEQSLICNVEQLLTEYNKEQGKVGATIYTNITENLESGAAISENNLTYKIKYGEEQQVPNTSFHANTKKIQVETQPASPRIYQVTVKVFDGVDTGFSGEPLATLTGAILK